MPLPDNLNSLEARLPWMLARHELMVIMEHQASWIYQYVPIDSEQLGVYNAPNIKNNTSHSDITADEYLFLPITVGEFTNHRETYRGYQFIFTMTGLETATLLGIPDSLQCQITMNFTARLVTYQTRGISSIVIKRIGDPIFPAKLITIGSVKNEIDERMIKCYWDTMREYCRHYLLNDI